MSRRQYQNASKRALKVRDLKRLPVCCYSFQTQQMHQSQVGLNYKFDALKGGCNFYSVLFAVLHLEVLEEFDTSEFIRKRPRSVGSKNGITGGVLSISYVGSERTGVPHTQIETEVIGWGSQNMQDLQYTKKAFDFNLRVFLQTSTLFLRPMIKRLTNAMKQSEFPAITCKLLIARENLRIQAAIGVVSQG